MSTLTADPGYLLMVLGGFSTPAVPLSADSLLESNFFGHMVMSKAARGNVDGLTMRFGEIQVCCPSARGKSSSIRASPLAAKIALATTVAIGGTG